MCDLKKVGSPMSQRAMNGDTQQEFSVIIDRFITLHCRVGAGVSISDKALFPAFRAFWINQPLKLSTQRYLVSSALS